MPLQVSNVFLSLTDCNGGRSNSRSNIAQILSRSREDTVHTEAYQSPNTFVENITKVTPAQNGVTLHETITLKAPDLLFNYAFGQAQTAHEEMLKRIRNFVENA